MKVIEGGHCMARLGRKGQILKWAGLVLSSIIVLAWAMSMLTSWSYGLFYQNVFLRRFSLFDGRIALTDAAIISGFQGRWGWNINPISHEADWVCWYQGGSPYTIVLSLWILYTGI